MAGKKMITETKAKIIEIKEEAKEIRTFTLQLEKKIDYNPGEFIFVWFPEQPEIKRAYSIAGYSKDNLMKLTIQKVEEGKFTTELFNAKKGKEIIVKGSFGSMKYEGEKKIVMLAAGTGIAPFMGFMDYFKTMKCPEKAYLFYSFKHPNKKVDLTEHLKGIKCMEIILTCPKAGKECIQWNGLKEYIDAKVMKRFIPNLNEFTFFLCGSHKLVEEVTNTLIEEGIPEEKIKHEKF
ncbi:MAG: FAD-dependent oxidoreductase [Candidatus Diapherotrites archaeon]|nr:FAD-dependent oxidoreductase [Candidatus Diapherotrites archaeon]